MSRTLSDIIRSRIKKWREGLNFGLSIDPPPACEAELQKALARHNKRAAGVQEVLQQIFEGQVALSELAANGSPGAEIAKRAAELEPELFDWTGEHLAPVLKDCGPLMEGVIQARGQLVNRMEVALGDAKATTRDLLNKAGRGAQDRPGATHNLRAAERAFELEVRQAAPVRQAAGQLDQAEVDLRQAKEQLKRLPAEIERAEEARVALFEALTAGGGLAAA